MLRSIPASQTNCPSAGFSDLYASAWYHPYTDFVLRQELMVGVGGGRFAPNGAVTRAMVVTILYRMAGSPEVETASTFRDVPENAWYAPAVSWAQSQGIALGVTAERFAPDATATREQQVTFLYRYGAYAGLNMAEGGDLSPYPDGSAVAGYAAGAMAWAIGTGIVEGDETGRLLPKATATRAQMAAMVTRFLK